MRCLRILAATLAIAAPSALLATDGTDDADERVAEAAVSGALEREAAEPAPEGATPQALCIFLHKRGAAKQRLGRYDEALADLRQALLLQQNRLRASAFWCDRWRLQSDIYSALYASGDWLALIADAQAVADEYRERNAWNYFAAQLWLIDPQVNLGNLRRAEAAFREATAALPALKAMKAWQNHGASVLARHSTYAAWLQELRGNHDEAERLRRQALEHAQAYRDHIVAIRPPDHHDVRGAVAGLTTRKRHLAALLAIQGKFGEAELLARQALQETLARSARNTLAVASALGSLGRIKLQQGEVAEALRLQEEAQAALAASGARPYSTALANIRADIGFLLGAQDRWAEALAVFELRDQGLRGNAAQFARTGSNNLNWAMALVRTGRAAEGEAMLRAILAHNRRKPFVDPLYVAHLRGYLGIALLASGKTAAAAAEFREALPVLVRQAETDSSADNGGFVRTYRLRLIAEAHLDLLSRQAADDGTLAGEAFRIAEIARGSRVQQAIANSAARANLHDPALARLARSTQDTANQIGALNNLLVRLAAAPDAERLDKTIADIRGDLDKLEETHAKLRGELDARFPAYADLVAPQAPFPAALQKVLQPEEAVVAIYAAEDRTYVWTIVPDRLAFRAVAGGRAALQRQVAALRAAVDLAREPLPAFPAAAAQALYDGLLAPDAALWAKAKVLNVIPHAALGQLPFAMLLTGPAVGADPAAWPWLAKRVAIAQQPSAGTLIALRQADSRPAAQRPFIGFGDPVFAGAGATGRPAARRNVRNLQIADAPADKAPPTAARPATRGEPAADSLAAVLSGGFARLPALPDTADELRQIGKTLAANREKDLYLGPRASEANVKGADLASYRVLAFATHGLVPGDLRGLDQPSLALANPALAGDRENDGFLTMGEVLGLKLDADWVVLSACNTASGDGKSEEAVSGLGKAFFFAGTRRLLVSYWPVETVSARLLTTGLFQRLTQHPDESKAEALRQSMLGLMASQRGYAHPAFWAPFGLIGNGAR